MRICHVLNAVNPTTGPANHAIALEKHTDADVGVLAWFDREPFDEEELLYDVTCLSAPRQRFGLDRATYKWASKHLKEYDLIHAHHPHSGSFAKFIGWQQGKTLVSTEGSNHDKFTRKGRIANGLTNTFSDRVTCVSQSVYDSFSTWEAALLNPEQVEVIYTGVDLTKIARRTETDWDVAAETDVSSDSILVSTAARFHYVKAHETLIRGVAAANEQSEIDIELVIAGDGDRRQFLETEAKRRGVEDMVHFPGLLNRTDVYCLMEQSDIFGMSSRWEGFCSAVLEAMAIGTPCVLSDIRSFRETFGEIALFHELENPTSLADCLLRFIRDEKLRVDYAQRAKRRVETKYTMEETARNYYDLYQRVLK